MTDQELRALVRDAIARRTAVSDTVRVVSDTMSEPDPARDFRANVAFAMLPLARGGDGPCLIEPGVRCSHCGYCLSFGH